MKGTFIAQNATYKHNPSPIRSIPHKEQKNAITVTSRELTEAIFNGPSSFDILHGHSRATMFLIANNTAQAILSSFFFKYACWFSAIATSGEFLLSSSQCTR
ncbi:unnamed protein product [Prunus armeniaca]|uniref:Uncharacterized protein n=1 Tax=Prunus armeniaca TaxID=36596 RepID=A0A6J5W7P8_PRUAR|nr:unnamed protein product [Prunus armeniaca]